jgi:hypothetical protein
MKATSSLKLLAATALVLGSLSAVGLAASDGQAEQEAARAGARRVQTSCAKVAKVEVAQSSVGQSTTSSAFVDVIGSTVSFNIPGSANTCVLVDFSAQGFTGSAVANVLFVQAVRDNAIVSVDGSIQFISTDQDFSDAHAYNFLFTNVPPGAHTVKMQYRSNLNGTSVAINDFNMTVNHK